MMDERMNCTTSVLHSDEDILASTLSSHPDVVSIDAPLFLPRGRKSLDVKGPPHFRECDKELLKMHIKFFPISLGPMRMLTARGIHLRSQLEAQKIEVIESFPGAIQDMLGMPRKQGGLALLQGALSDFGVGLEERAAEYTGDELDAVTSALVGLMYSRGDFVAIGDPAEGVMILPRIDRPRHAGR